MLMPGNYRKTAVLHKEMLWQETHDALLDFPWEMPLAAVPRMPAAPLTAGGPALWRQDAVSQQPLVMQLKTTRVADSFPVTECEKQMALLHVFHLWKCMPS